MDLYLKVPCAHFHDGLSGRAIARDFGICRNNVAKMLAYFEPPGYQRTAPITRPKLDAFTDQIDIWLAQDKGLSRKQRHTAKRIFDWLRAECEFTGGYTIVKDYLRNQKRGGKEMFVPLSHPAGYAQADFGKALVGPVPANKPCDDANRGYSCSVKYFHETPHYQRTNKYCYKTVCRSL